MLIVYNFAGCIVQEEIFNQNVTLRRDLMSQPGVVPNIMEALETKKMDVLHAVLKVINIVRHPTLRGAVAVTNYKFVCL